MNEAPPGALRTGSVLKIEERRHGLPAGASSAMIQFGKGLSSRCPSPAPPHELVRKGRYDTIFGRE